MDLLEAYEVFSKVYDSYTTETGDIPFYRALAEESGGPVLELACGTGRITRPLARDGLEVWALDFSAPMLERARRRLARAKPAVRDRVRFVEGDMRNFNLGRRFPLAILAYSSFLHLLDPESQLDCLACVRRHLLPGGRFALDVVEASPYLLYQSKLGKTVTTDYGITPDGDGWIRAFEDEYVDLESQNSRCTYRIWDCREDGRCLRLRCRFELALRYVFAAELRLLFRLAGFDAVELFDDFQGSLYRADSGRIVAVGHVDR